MNRPDPEQEPDPLAEAMLPVLVHRMNNSTQLLSNLRTVLQAAPGRDWLGERAEDLADTYGELRVTGYLLAVLSSASGADLLGGRHEPRGLVWFVRAVGEVLRREGGRLREPVEELPSLTTGAGWELPWLVARLLHSGGRAARVADVDLEWELVAASDGTWRLRVAPAPPLTPALERLVARLGGAELAVGEEGLELSLPAEYLRSES